MACLGLGRSACPVSPGESVLAEEAAYTSITCGVWPHLPEPVRKAIVILAESTATEECWDVPGSEGRE